MEKASLDEQLIPRIATGDRNAFTKVYEATRSIVYSFGLSILKNKQDAEDIMHDTYIKIFQNAASYQASGKPLAWILTIVKHLSYNRIRDRKPAENIDDYALSPGVSETEAADNKMIVDSLIRTLADDERQIVVLHAAGGMKHREIAELLDIPLSTVLSKYNRSLRKLRNQFTEKEAAV